MDRGITDDTIIDESNYHLYMCEDEWNDIQNDFVMAEREGSYYGIKLENENELMEYLRTV
jgi:hypothetical protein